MYLESTRLYISFLSIVKSPFSHGSNKIGNEKSVDDYRIDDNLDKSDERAEFDSQEDSVFTLPP